MDAPGPERPAPLNADNGVPAGERLDSWKEIAAFLKRDVATVRRWEKREGLPVHRHQHSKLGSVYAIPSEIQAWQLARRRLADSTGQNGNGQHDAQNGGVSRPVAVAAGVALLALAAWVIAQLASGPVTERVEFALGSDSLTMSSVAISPDGKRLVFDGSEAGQPSRLWVRWLDAATPAPLGGTEGAALPFWSNDGKHVGFFADSKLKKIDLATGVVETICPAGPGRGASWNADGVIVFSPRSGVPLFRVAATGGTPLPLTSLDQPGDLGHKWPAFLPDGKHLLYYNDTGDPEREGVYLAALDGPTSARLLPVSSNAVPGPDGQVLFIQGTRLLAQSLDVRSGRLTGEVSVVADPVLQQYDLDHKGDFSASVSGVLAYRSGTRKPSPLVWRDRQGNQIGTVGEPAVYGAPVISPDGTRVAAVRFDGDSRHFKASIWVTRFADGLSKRASDDLDVAVTPLWLNREQVAFSTMHGGSSDIVQGGPIYGVPQRVLLQATGMAQPEALSRDGQFIFYATFNRKTRFDTWAVPASGKGERFAVLQGSQSEGQTQFSPDGRFMSFTSDENGRPEIYVMSYPPSGQPLRVTYTGGSDARWSGSELFYIGLDRSLMAVPFSSNPVFQHGTPQRLFDTRISDSWEEMRNHYDVTSDGRRFLFTVPLDEARLTPFTVRIPISRPKSR